MNDEARFTEAQRRTVQSFKGWQLFRRYPNEDIVITVGNRFYRINKDGLLVEKWGGGEAPTPPAHPIKKPIRPSLSEELTTGLKTPKPTQLPLGPQPIPPISTTPIKAEKKYEYKTYPTKTICQEIPECCQPRQIKSVFWDADHTIWDLEGTAASVTGTLKKMDDDTIVELSSRPRIYGTEEPYAYEMSATEEEILKGLSPEERDFLIKELEKEHRVIRKPKAEKLQKAEHVRTTIKLDPTFRKTLDELDKRNIPSSVISLNTPGSVKRILREFGLESRFAEIRDSYENKGKVFRELALKQHICPCDGLFVDDSRSNTEAVSENCGIALQIGKGKDITQTIDVLKYIKD